MEKSWYFLKHQIIIRNKWSGTSTASGDIPSEFPEGRGGRPWGCDHHPSRVGQREHSRTTRCLMLFGRKRNKSLKLGQKSLFTSVLCLFLCETSKKTFNVVSINGSVMLIHFSVGVK
ncbi:unnamed protein product [Gulo gulo]|uniref:Uncharacterized protein n=1 Tax=Gulo gulo TaxID=48420 RepID=A0A9X9LIP0_GULGU|nr:unnamed protein product [Gulo gulo]